MHIIRNFAPFLFSNGTAIEKPGEMYCLRGKEEKNKQL